MQERRIQFAVPLADLQSGRLRYEASHKKRGDSHDRGDTQQVAQQVIQITDQSIAREGEMRPKTLEEIAEVDEQVEEEAPGHKGMRDTGERPGSEDRPERQGLG